MSNIIFISVGFIICGFSWFLLFREKFRDLDSSVKELNYVYMMTCGAGLALLVMGLHGLFENASNEINWLMRGYSFVMLVLIYFAMRYVAMKVAANENNN